MPRRTVLVVSPTPPIPRDYGNRNRVFQTISFFKRLQFDVSLLLYPMDDDWVRSIPPYYQELVDMCDYFAIVPNSRRLHQAAVGFHHQIDEWWDENIGRQLEWLFARKSFNIIFVNYTFFSSAFNFAPRGVIRMLDTHDIFSGRREVFERHGVGPEFFYTTAEEEQIAFNRADCIIAIKQSEADFIRTRTDKTVVSLPYWDMTAEAAEQGLERTRMADAFGHDRPLVLGFIGALNSVNSVNLTRFLDKFQRFVLLYDLPVRILVAGNVCETLPDLPFLEKLGRIPSVDDFYRAIDAVIAPLEFSTGIKIKVGEALAWGLPVLATENAFDGFKQYHFTQALPDVHALCESIADLATNQISMKQLRLAAGRAGLAAAKAQDRGFEQLRAFIAQNTRRIVIFTTRPFWHRGTLVDEQIAQIIEYFSAIEPVIVLFDHDDRPNAAALFCKCDWQRVRTEELSEVLGEMSLHSHIVGLIHCDGDEQDLTNFAALPASLRWSLSFAPPLGAGRTGVSKLVHGNGAPTPSDVAVSVCRYLPPLADRAPLAERVVIYLPEQPTEWEQIIFEAAATLCRERNLAFAERRVGRYFEFHPGFFRDLMKESAARSILIGPRGWEFAISQINDYRGAATLLVHEDHIVPEALDARGQPSLFGAMERFLDQQISANMFGGPNAGWDQVWGMLSNG